jgi:hypothetical protein
MSACVICVQASRLHLRSSRFRHGHPSHHVCLDSLTAIGLLDGGLVLEHGVHLLESAAGCLGHEEIYPHHRDRAEGGKEDVSSKADVLDHWGSNQALEESVDGLIAQGRKMRTHYDEIVAPVGHGTECAALRAKAAGEDFSRHSPRDGSPSCAERQHEEEEEGDTCPCSSLMIGPFPVVFADENGDDEMCDEHADTTAKQ